MESIFCGCLVGENREGKIGGAWVFSLWVHQNVFFQIQEKTGEKTRGCVLEKIAHPNIQIF